MNTDNYDKYVTFKTAIKDSGFTDYSSPLEELPIYQSFYNELRVLFDMLDAPTSTVQKKRLNTPESLYLLYKKLNSSSEMGDYLTFLVFISQKMTDRNGKATRFGVNLRYSSAYLDGCKLYEQLCETDQFPQPKMFLFLKNIKDNSNNPRYIRPIEADFNDRKFFAKAIYNIAISAAVFSQIEEMHNNAKRNLSSGKLLIKSPDKQIEAPLLKYNPAERDGSKNLPFIKMCLELCKALLNSDDLRRNAKAYYNTLIPLHIDKVSGTALVLAGANSLPKDYKRNKFSSLYIATLSFFREHQRLFCTHSTVLSMGYSAFKEIPSNQNEKGNYYIQNIENKVTKCPSDDANSLNVSGNHPLFDFFGIFDNYNHDVKCDRQLIRRQNANIPDNCPKFFSAFFVSERSAARSIQMDTKTLQEDKKRIYDSRELDM